MFVTVRENAFGEEKVLEFCGGTYSEVRQGKLRVVVASKKPVYVCYLNLVVKHLHFLIVPHSESCGIVFLPKYDKTKNSSGL